MNKQKGLAPILIVLLIAAVIGGYLLYSGKINLNQTTQPSPTTNVSPAPTGDAETANWKTYTNTKYKYSFKYPSHYNFLDAELMSQSTTNDEFMVSFLKYSSNEAQKYKINNREEAFYDYFGVVVQGGNCSSLTTPGNVVTIDGVSGKKYTGSSSTFADPQFGDILVLVNKNNYCYHLAFLKDPRNPKSSEALFDQILSTFKFIN